jgi:hypothetical protein
MDGAVPKETALIVGHERVALFPLLEAAVAADRETFPLDCG